MPSIVSGVPRPPLSEALLQTDMVTHPRKGAKDNGLELWHLSLRALPTPLAFLWPIHPEKIALNQAEDLSGQMANFDQLPKSERSILITYHALRRTPPQDW
jgi:hypothetical protein